MFKAGKLQRVHAAISEVEEKAYEAGLEIQAAESRQDLQAAGFWLEKEQQLSKKKTQLIKEELTLLRFQGATPTRCHNLEVHRHCI